MKTRGFEPVSPNNCKQNCTYIRPARMTKCSAGYDLYSPCEVTLQAGKKATIWLNIKAYMPPNEVLKIYIRSSLAITKSIVLMNQVGIVDSDYYNNPDNEGNIAVCLWNTSDSIVIINPGERIAQGIFQKYLLTDNDKVNEARAGGIGSTNDKEAK